MNIFICGQKSFGKEVLKALYEKGHNIVGVAPPPQEKYYDKMQGYAIKLGIPVISDCDRLVSRDIPEETDLVIAAHSHWYISTKIIEKAKYSLVKIDESSDITDESDYTDDFASNIMNNNYLDIDEKMTELDMLYDSTDGNKVRKLKQ